MKRVIDLSKEGFDFDDFVKSTPMSMTWSKKGVLCKLADFGTVIIGLEKVKNPDFVGEILNHSMPEKAPLFFAPVGWHWGQIARSFGVFKSATQARKNGWDGEPDPGFNFRQFKINRVRGELMVLRITDDSPWVTGDF